VIAHLSPQAIAMNRFGLGARPDDAVPDNPRHWLLAQFAQFKAQTPAYTALPDANALIREYQETRRASTLQDRTKEDLLAQRKMFATAARDLYHAAVLARVDAALNSPAPFVERLVHFWANHFCISADDPRLVAYAGAFERDAIRPHVLGRFADMLLAVEQHPAMLIYLNQNASIGPDSIAALQADRRDAAHKRGLNENLGREALELHTMGARSGYTQSDVTEFSRALTGWSTGDGRGSQAEAGDPSGFAYRDRAHEPGDRTVLGQTYADTGEDQAKTILSRLATSPATARHIATKLAIHFAGDTPPGALIAKLQASFIATGGDLPSLYHVLITASEAWQSRPLKFKTPWDWTISVLRGLGETAAHDDHIVLLERQLGQPVWKPGAPAGWDDTSVTWATPAALMQRMNAASGLAERAGDRLDARDLAPQLLPASLSPVTAQQIRQAESPQSALALLLVSPDFLRR